MQQHSNGPAKAENPQLPLDEGAPQDAGKSSSQQADNEGQLQLARSEGGVSNTELTSWPVTFQELCKQFIANPPVGDKDGSYFVRATLQEGYHTRTDDNLGQASIIVLDGDSQYDPATGEITDGAPYPEQVHEVLVTLGLNHCLYTTWSHQQTDKGNRYRIIIPAIAHDKGDLTGILEWIFQLLEEKGVYLVNVKENTAWSQPWYFPRRAGEEAAYQCLHHVTGHPLDVAEALAWYATKKPPVESHELPALQRVTKSRDPDSLFARFNAQHGNAEWMLTTLNTHGYKLKGVSEVNRKRSYRLLSPHSSSGSPGIIVFCGNDDVWRVYSHHNEQEPLSRSDDKVSACDAFDLFCLLEHNGSESAATSAWERASDPRPVIRIKGGRLHTNQQLTIKALADENPPRVYQRAHGLYRIAHLKEAAETEGCTIPAGTAHIVPLQKSVLTVLLSEIIRWEKYTKGNGWTGADPCQKVVAGVHDGFGYWEGIPTLIGICEAPILRSDGTLLSNAGYDPASGLYVEGNAPDISLPKHVSLEDAHAAALMLLEPFKEFPFVESDLDLAVLLALLFTLALRPQLPTAPLTCISATTPGTGKGLLVEVANLLVRGRDAATMPPTQGKGGEDEMRKRITALLLQGIASINLDNYTRAIGGESLNALMTTPEWTDRVLSRSVSVTVPVRCTLVATGNNLTVKGDMTRRSLAILLDAKMERPELRTFKQKDLPGQILRDRGVLLKHLFTILKGYQQAGSPGSDQHLLGRFEEWTAKVCGPIRWLGYPDPLDSQERLRELDPEAERLGVLMEAWWIHLPLNWHTAGDLIKAAEDTGGTNGQQKEREALRSALREVAGEGRDCISNRLLGWYLGSKEGRIVEDFRLERRPKSDTKSKKSQQYRVVNTTLLDSK